MTNRDELFRFLHDYGDGGIWESFDRKNSQIVADALAPFIERAKAQALRDAANVCRNFPGADDTDISTARWLHLHADAIEKDTP